MRGNNPVGAVGHVADGREAPCILLVDRLCSKTLRSPFRLRRAADCAFRQPSFLGRFSDFAGAFNAKLLH
jgi:hypothetical protein